MRAERLFCYIDTSALVKRYIAEEHSDAVHQDLFSVKGRAFFTSALTRIELFSAICRRMSEYPTEVLREVLSAIAGEWGYWIEVAIDDSLIQRAEKVACQHKLRTYDAIHLSAVLMLWERYGDEVFLATFDRQMHAVAQKEGLSVWPPVL